MTHDRSQQAHTLTPERREDYRDFLERFQADPTSISGKEASSRYRELLGLVPSSVATNVQNQMLGHLPQEDQQALVQHLTLSDNGPSGPQSLGMLDRLLGKDSPLNTPMGRVLLAAAAAYLAKRLLSGQASQGGAQAPTSADGGIADILSGLLGGQAQAPASASASSGGLGSIISVLLGGQPAAGPGGQAPGGGLTDILSGLLGGGQPSSASAGGQPGGLGDILGGLLGGQEEPSDASAPTQPSSPPLGSIRKDR